MRPMLALVAVMSLFGLGVSAAPDTPAGFETCTIRIEGMQCSACAARVERELKKVDGVASASVSQPKGLAEVTFDPAQTTPEKLARLISDNTGFTAEPVEP
jgi:P-type Cu+ transporter